MQDMLWSQKYAFHNRRFMMDILVECINDVVHKSPEVSKLINRYAIIFHLDWICAGCYVGSCLQTFDVAMC